MPLSDFDYPELMAKGTMFGPVTVEMRERCQAKIRNINRAAQVDELYLMVYWPDLLPIVRLEMSKEGPW